jgi:hypothetical protein
MGTNKRRKINSLSLSHSLPEEAVEKLRKYIKREVKHQELKTICFITEQIKFSNS